jgi:O-antigen/teichoic acid export membrane protein
MLLYHSNEKRNLLFLKKVEKFCMNQEKSIRKNFILNIIKTIMNIIFPLITFPYVSRILLPEGVGKVNFAQSIIAYFVVVSAVGISTYGVREAAKIRDDKDKLSKLVQELLIINMISTVIVYILFFIFIMVQSNLKNKGLLLVMSSTILFTTIGLEWLYNALEEYAYITIRSIAFQFISLVLLFIFVRTKNDYLNYAVLLVISSVGSNILNFFHARKFINCKWYKNYELKRHIKPLSIMFAMSITTTIYLNLDSVMLGYISGDAAVGLYTTSMKINKIVLAIVLSMGTVLMPRLSFYYNNDKKEIFNKLIGKSLDLMLMIALPCIIGMSLLSNEIILLISGKEFITASLAMKILNPIILVIGLSHLIGLQILVPIGKEKYTLYSFGAGAIASFLLNILLIPKFSYNGAAVATLVAESSVTLTQMYFGWEYVKDKLFTKSKLSYIIGSFLIIIVVLFVKKMFVNYIYVLLISISLSSLIYALTLIIMKDEFALEITNRLKSAFKNAL